MRKPMVTRTFNKTTTTVMCVNTQEGKIYNIDLITARPLTDKQAVKQAQAQIEEGHISVKVINTVQEEVLYGMSEEDFIKYAQVLPPRSQEDTQE